MRYYNLYFTDANGNAPTNIPMQIPSSAAGQGYPYMFTSHTKSLLSNTANANLGALDIEFDITLGFLHNLATQTHFRIYNPTMDMVRYASIYQGLYVTLNAGFLYGLPLANSLATKSGLIFKGYIQNCFANWMGTQIALDFIATTSPQLGNPDRALPTSVQNSPPVSIVFAWKDNQPLYIAIQESLNAIGISLSGSIASILKARTGADYSNGFTSMQAFAQYINKLSLDNHANMGANGVPYSGVMMEFNNATNTITVSDSVYPGPPVQLNHGDFIGQPTFNTSQIMVVNKNQVIPAEILSAHPLRNDLVLNANVVYPSNVNIGATPTLPFDSDKFLVRGKSNSQVITEIRHVGRFRDPNALGWATHIRCNYAGPYAS